MGYRVEGRHLRGRRAGRSAGVAPGSPLCVSVPGRGSNELAAGGPSTGQADGRAAQAPAPRTSPALGC